MFLFNRKRIVFITSILVSSIFYSSLLKQSNNYFSPVSSTPVSNHIIILDAGHGKPDGGAVSNDGNTIESELNLEIVLKLQKLLESSDCTVILTRSDESGIYNTDCNSIRSQKISDMKNRVSIANNSNADLFLSIHMNKLEQTQYSGWQTFYKNDDIISKSIAQNIQSSLNLFMKRENKREIKSISGIYLTKHVKIPMILVECGFLSNIEETSLLKDETYQNELAWSIYIGLMDYLK